VRFLVCWLAGSALLCAACTSTAATSGQAPSIQRITVSPTHAVKSKMPAPVTSTVSVVVVTKTEGPPQPVRPQVPTDAGALRRAFNSAIPVDPNPYMGAHPNVYFTSPTHNIGCYIFIDFSNRVECTIAKYNFSQPGADCPGGAVVSIEAERTPSIPTCTTEPVFAVKTLQYGQSVTNGQLACVSAPEGVSCLDLTTGAGFTLNRDQYIPIR
jgi:hypothetical protein